MVGKMKVLVTGSEGYIGSVLVDKLLEKGYDVTGLDACFLGNRNFGDSFRKHRLIVQDIRDIDIGALEGFDAICHLAAISNDPSGELNEKVTYDINHKGSVSLAKKAKQAGVKRFVFSSSCSLYGAGMEGEALTEDSKLNPLTAYARSKVLAEEGISKLADDNFSPVFLRNATVYGLSRKLRLDVVVNNLIALALTTGKIAMTSDGTPWRPIIHIDDVCHAFECAVKASKENVHNEIFNIGRTSENYQIKTIAEMIKICIPGVEITFGEQKEQSDKRSYKVSFEKAETSLLGYNPTCSLGSEIYKIRDALKGEILAKSLNGNEFITINRYKELLETNQIDSDFRWRNNG